MRATQEKKDAIKSHKIVVRSIEASLKSEKIELDRLPAIQLQPNGLKDYLDRIEYYYALACALRLLELLQSSEFNLSMIPEDDLILIREHFIEDGLLDIHDPDLTQEELERRFEFIEYLREELMKKMEQ